MSNANIPGTGMTYEDLRAQDCGSVIRETWSLLADAAVILGIDTSAPSGLRSKTIDELLDDLNEMLPEGVTPEDIMHATEQVELDSQEVTFEVRHLREVGDHWEWVPFETHESLVEAEKSRDFWIGQEGEAYVVVRVTKSLSRKVEY